jgi:glycosyltransferase involved in cell wall biosynthesis
MRIGIDYTAAVRQVAGIGRYTRELVSALLALESDNEYVIFAATGELRAGRWEREQERLRAAAGEHDAGRSGAPGRALAFRSLPLSDEWMARLWHRLRLPIPIEAVTGPLDLLYCPDFVLPPTRRATRTVVTVHDLSFLRWPEAYVAPLRRYLERVVPRSVTRADLVLADSAHTRSDIVSLLGGQRGKVRVLLSGVDPRFHPGFEVGDRAHLQAFYGFGERPYVLSVGTLQPRKNYVRLIQAFTALDTQTQLVIAGAPGWLYDEILAEAELHGERVRVVGFVDDADLPLAYRNAALFAMPSLYEGFGLPVLEAMACGVPVVCSNTSSLPEVAGDAALLIDPLDISALSQAMARALEDERLRQEMVAKGQKQSAHFTWQRAARELLCSFEQAAGDVDT